MLVLVAGVALIAVSASCSSSTRPATTRPPTPTPSHAPRADIVALADRITLPSSFTPRARFNRKPCPRPGGRLLRCWRTRQAPVDSEAVLARAAAAVAGRLPSAVCGPPQDPRRDRICRIDFVSNGWTVLLTALPLLGGSPAQVLGPTIGSDVTLTIKPDSP